MKIVYVYSEKNLLGDPPQRLKDFVGRKFKSFNSIIDELQEGDVVTVETSRGYKQVGLKDGCGWLQRNYSYEY